VFQDRERLFRDEEFEVTCTYLEVYNEVRVLRWLFAQAASASLN